MPIDRDLTDDLTWREAELATLKAEVAVSTPNSVKESALLRALWALLYAHYEGFTVFAWQLYLDEVARLKIPRGDLPENLNCLSLRKEISSVKNSYSDYGVLRFYADNFPKLLREPASFPVGLKANSNLHPDLYIENSKNACLPFNKMIEYETRMKLLVSRRNAIAHGENIRVKNLREYQDFEDATTTVMHELAISIVDSVAKMEVISPTRQRVLL